MSPAQLASPVITSIVPNRTNAIIEVSIPVGVKRVVLESRSRLDAGAWTPAAVGQTDGKGGLLKFRIPLSDKMEVLRVRADYSLPLPAAFYGPTNAFWGAPTNNVSLPEAIASDGRNLGPAEREVVESDVWKFQGDRLYFFNQYRGLQVIDISDPDNAEVTGTFALPSAGEDMYLLGADHVVLLARNGCYFPSESQVLIISATNASKPEAVAKLPVQGYIQESRMVGSALYVASQAYRQLQESTNTTWEWGTVVSSYDLSEPAKPIARETLWFPGYGNAVMATDILLFVGSADPRDYYKTVVQIMDISSPDGRMSPYGTIRTSGRVEDKFKMNYAQGILTTIAQDQRRTNGVNVTTWLETFRVPDPRLAGPAGIMKLGELELGRGEQLHATRFDGDKVYVVTFFRVDPLWIVDISDPARPRIAGELEVPGWSTYIHPMGDRLLSIGVETNRVAVSLFDVAEPAKPALLNRVLLGNNYSWSEANYDEKAFTVLEDEGLVLVPYSGDTTNGWAARVQLIDLTTSNLVARGMIEHQLQPRRSAVHRERVLSLSGWELLSVNITNRDLPTVTGEVALAWSVDRLFLAGNHLLQLTGSGYGWDPQNETSLFVSPAENPDAVLATLPLGRARLAGATLADGFLFVAQTRDSESEKAGMTFILSVLDVSALPAVQLLGQVALETSETGWNWGNWWPVWAGKDILVWAGGGYDWWGPWLRMTDGFAGGLWRWPWPTADVGGGHLLAFRVTDPAKPELASEMNLTPMDTWRRYSLPSSVGTMVYLSHSASELQPGTTNTWVERHYLDVVDYADPASPTLRKPVNLPGMLQGLSHGGEMLYTKGAHWTTNDNYWREWLDGLAYDGVTAHLVASLEMPADWPQPLALDGPRIYLGRAQYNDGTTGAKHALERWVLSDTGKFELDASTAMKEPVSSLWVKSGLVAVQENYQSVILFDGSAAGQLRHVGRVEAPGCLNFFLNRSEGALERGIWIPMGSFGVSWTPMRE